MGTENSCQPSPQSAATVADSHRVRSFGRTRRFSGRTRRLTPSDHTSLGWRIIAGGSRPGEARGLLRAWPRWERLAKSMWPIIEIPGARYGMLHLRTARYRGEPLVLPDGTKITEGSLLGELHCNNGVILQLVREDANPFAARRLDLRSLSKWIEQDSVGVQIEALRAGTILTTAASRLGFTVLEKPVTFRRRLEKFYFKGLLLLYNKEGLARILRGNTGRSYPGEVWMSRRELIRQYGSKPQSQTPWRVLQSHRQVTRFDDSTRFEHGIAGAKMDLRADLVWRPANILI